MCVGEPRPEIDIKGTYEDADAEMEDLPRNEFVPLPAALNAQVDENIGRLRRRGVELTSPTDGVDAAATVEMDVAVVTAEAGVVVFRAERTVPGDTNEVYREFQELMVTLGHADDAGAVVSGTHLAPHPKPKSHFDRSVDIGMGATAYREVPDPHEYWMDCDTLEDYIDMCVENGADREELEARDTYLHHFHPQTTHRDLDSEQEAAIEAWRDTLRDIISPCVELGEAVTDHGLVDVCIDEDGTTTVQYSIRVGELPGDDTAA
ncbi:hypothetical protein [Salinibaculum rarum]|uniref:hypothetical protein n=1 Tax=Salinibaculum rarum TaxID=3058903 RepID=UPI00265E75BD|nr:hypothetical protein [Salinibaculum sp. KK48]